MLKKAASVYLPQTQYIVEPFLVDNNTNDVVYKRLSIKKASNDYSGICFFILPYFIGCFSSSRVKPSPMTSCTDVIATKACGSTSSIIVFNFTISFLP